MDYREPKFDQWYERWCRAKIALYMLPAASPWRRFFESVQLASVAMMNRYKEKQTPKPADVHPFGDDDKPRSA